MANVMDSMTGWMNEHIAPLAGKLGQNRVLSSINQGMMTTMPLTVGVAAISIIVNLPIPGFSDWLANSGLTACATEVINSTMSLMGIYVSFLIAYAYAKNDGMNPVTAGVLSMASFLILVPSTITLDAEAGTTLSTYGQSYLGSNGIFIGIFGSVAIAWLYGWLTRKNIKLTLPDSVPPMVADSMSPVFTAMIIFGIVFLIKWGFTFTPWGNVFDFVSSAIAAPLMNVGSSPISMIVIFTACNLVWFFGIHPNSVLSVFMPVLMVMAPANIEAYLAGEPMPYLMTSLIYSCCYFGGTGNTIGLCFDLWTAKSERYKSVRTLMTVPNLFNINEPVIFGMPVMLNPVFFIPMVLSSVVPGLIGWLYLSVVPVNFNPTISMPWAFPTPISMFFSGGITYFLLGLICWAISAVLYYPFFKIADNQALAEEQAQAASNAAE